MSRFAPREKITVSNARMQPPQIEGISTSTAAFLGETEKGPTSPTLVTSWGEFQKLFGGYLDMDRFLPYSVEGFFLNGGKRCFIRKIVNGDYPAALAELETVDEISILYCPNAQVTPGLADLLIDHCELLRSRFAIFDSIKGQGLTQISKPRASSYAAFYYPWIQVKNAVQGQICLVPPGGHVAGIYVHSDIEAGVNKAPANQVVMGAVGTEFDCNQRLFEPLEFEGLNCIRTFAGRGIRIWGARTLSDDPFYKYVSVRRMLIYLEQSISKGLAWAVFEFNNEALWTKVKVLIESFLNEILRTGMLMGAKPQEAYFVKVDRTTMTQSDIDSGRLMVLIGIAITKPAEFMIIRIGQTTAKPS